jgi:hypothetical protein
LMIIFASRVLDLHSPKSKGRVKAGYNGKAVNSFQRQD